MTSFKTRPELSDDPELAWEADGRADVDRRAARLCAGAEPHADEASVPCAEHVRQALSQLSLAHGRRTISD
ncbi:MAG: hypothetical protein M3256_07490 [Actinomycetota bacterium]|nr:hypothetical protein [Actinomycetota bacterium]MDQ6946105.1 hypothetical protein [Actinomycetota bacterium]